MHNHTFVLTLMAALFLLWGCPTEDDDDAADDDTGDDDTADDDDTGDDDTADDDDDSADDDDDTGDDDTEPDIIVGTATVPGEFAANPMMLASFFFVDMGDDEPAGIGVQIMNPVIGVGQPLDFTSEQDNLVGDYQIAIVLYVEGGSEGQGPPMAGVDYVWITEDPVPFGAGTIDLGNFEMFLFTEEPPPQE